MERAVVLGNERSILGMGIGDSSEHTLEEAGICVRDIELASGLLRKLKDVGVSISVDGFGTGYSSLSPVKSV